jgi:hypothetical protein
VAGQYNLTLAGTPPPEVNWIVNATVSINSPTTVVVAVGANIISVFLYQGTTLVDIPFFITVTDNS